MGCSYYENKGSFGFSPYCHKKGDYVNSDVYDKYCRGYYYSDCPIYKESSSSGGCYLTSACVAARGLPDDCHELTTLRAFRDGWLKAQPCGNCDIEAYYHTAPVIVARIQAQPDSASVFARIYEELVLPCVRWIEQNQMEQAYRHYKAFTLALEKKYLTE